MLRGHGSQGTDQDPCGAWSDASQSTACGEPRSIHLHGGLSGRDAVTGPPQDMDLFSGLRTRDPLTGSRSGCRTAVHGSSPFEQDPRSEWVLQRRQEGWVLHPKGFLLLQMHHFHSGFLQGSQSPSTMPRIRIGGCHDHPTHPCLLQIGKAWRAFLAVSRSRAWFQRKDHLVDNIRTHAAAGGIPCPGVAQSHLFGMGLTEGGMMSMSNDMAVFQGYRTDARIGGSEQPTRTACLSESTCQEGGIAIAQTSNPSP